ncbi:hypothetical protein MNBD_UNCLBAC01-824 [hydrothermal vent metagenome]|uniref:GAF domain-containing protein n=1 Tax=hydrothermal vent metagenome TaxID=652676 RepID=A0A3B1DK83_9ZZZZ
MNIHAYFQKNTCWQVLTHFIDVLRINMVIVDQEGHIIIPPDEQKYGGRLYLDSTLRAGFLDESPKFINSFKEHGKFLEYVNHFGLHSFALPISFNMTKKEKPSTAYMIIGPVILNKRLSNDDYLEKAQKAEVIGDALINEINTLKVVSNIMMNSILELLQKIIQNNITLSSQIETSYADSLESFLDLVVEMTESEFGSIMLLNEKNTFLTVEITKGNYNKSIQNKEIKIGEGIAGLAARENTSFLISKNHKQSRISHLLKRPEIKESLVMPLTDKNHIFGVLNLSTTKDSNKIEDNFDALQYLASQITKTSI